MAEEQAGQGDAQQGEQQNQQQGEQGAEAQGEQQAAPGKVYTQAELDRILGKVRKNARYLGRKEAEAERGAAPRQEQQTEQKAEPRQDAFQPRRDDESYEDFLLRKAEFAGRQGSREERAKAEKEAREKTVTEQRNKTEREFRKRAEALMAEDAEFADVIESADGVMITEAMAEAIKESAVGPRVLKHLAKNPEEAARIAGLTPNAAIREIGKLEARIEAEIAAKGKKDENKDAADDGEAGDDKDGKDEARAEAKGDDERNDDGTFKPKKKSPPEPIEPGSGRSANTNSLPSDKDDPDTWLRKRQAQIEREGRV